MRGVKAKALRRQAGAVTVGQPNVAYTEINIGRKQCGVIQLGNGLTAPNMVERATRVLVTACTRAVYQSLK